MSLQKIPIPPPIVMLRVNRRFRRRGNEYKLIKARSRGHAKRFGTYFLVNLKAESAEYKDVSLEELARQIGALRPYECVASR